MKSVAEIFGIETVDESLFEIALTHSSYTKEKDYPHTKCYERLEFLGDAVLKLAISDVLYRKYPNSPEGELSNIRSFVVSDNTLAKIANVNGLNNLIVLGKDAQKQGLRKNASINACAFEAILGAYYLEGKYKEVLEYIEKTFMPFIDDVDAHFEKFNAKAILQEYTQSKTKTTPCYNLIQEDGPPHKKNFTIAVEYEGKVLATETGSTKKEAEQKCAYSACLKLGIIKNV